MGGWWELSIDPKSSTMIGRCAHLPPPSAFAIPYRGRNIIWSLGEYHINERIRKMRNLRLARWGSDGKDAPFN